MDWASVYDRESPVLYRWLLARGANASLAEDVIQEVFMAVIRAGTVPDNPRAYLFSAARRTHGTLAKKTPVTIDEVPDLVDDDESDVDCERINMTLAELPTDQREVVVLHLWEEMTFVQVGEALNISSDTAASRWRYACDKLRNKLGDLK